MIQAREGEGFDPRQVGRAIKDAGFGPGRIHVRAQGILTRQEDLLALELPSAPLLLILAGGERIDDLRASGPALGSRIVVEGLLHPSHGDQPPGMEVQKWMQVKP